MRWVMALGVLMWFLIALWLVRLGLGLDHLSKDQVVIMAICGPIGGLAGWYYGRRYVEQLAGQPKR